MRLDRNVGTTTVALPNGTVFTTAEAEDGTRAWGCDGTPEQHTQDAMWLFGSGDPNKIAGRVKESLPYEVAGLLPAQQVYGRGDDDGGAIGPNEKIGSWQRGESPDMPKGLTVQGLSDMASEGYLKGVERLAAFTAKIANKVPVPSVIRARYRWADDGDDYDVLRTYSGDFEHAFGGWNPGSYRGPRIVTLYIPMGGSCMENWEQMFWRSAAGVAVTDVLMNAGFAVEVYGLFAADMNTSEIGKGGGDWAMHRYLIKRPGEFVNLSSIAYGCSLTAFFRTFGYPMNAFNPYAHGSGWGRPTPIGSDELGNGPGRARKAFELLGWNKDTMSQAVVFDNASNEQGAMAAADKALKALAASIDLDLEGVA